MRNLKNQCSQSLMRETTNFFYEPYMNAWNDTQNDREEIWYGLKVLFSNLITKHKMRKLMNKRK